VEIDLKLAEEPTWQVNLGLPRWKHGGLKDAHALTLIG
jgi:hypothetical protein